MSACMWRGLYDAAGTEQGDDAAAVAAADEAMKEAMDAEGSPMMSPGPEAGGSSIHLVHSFGPFVHSSIHLVHSSIHSSGFV